MPRAHVLPVIDDVQDVLDNIQPPSTSTVSTQTDDTAPGNVAATLQEKISALEQRHMHLTRAFSMLEMIHIPPQTRILMINEHSRILMDDIAPVLAHLETGNPSVWDIETILQGIITRWSEAECFTDMLGSTSIIQYPMTRARPVFSFKNYMDIFDPAKGTPSDAFGHLLGQFSIRLPNFRSQLSIIRPHLIYQDVIHGYLSAVLTCFLFHQKDKNAATYRYPAGAVLWTDYTTPARYQEDVVHLNAKDIHAVVHVDEQRPPGVIDIMAQRAFFKTHNKRKNLD